MSNDRYTGAKPKVTLITAPNWPLETIYCLRMATLNNSDLCTPLQLTRRYESEPHLRFEVEAMFMEVLHESIPVAENLHFTFLIENISVSFREQMVRHRVGVKIDERLGVDIIPDLNDSTWWSQSMRVIDMSNFAEDGMYRIPDSIREQPEILTTYNQFMAMVEKMYQAMVRAGIPAEDAREVLPLATTHRISWTLNLASLKHILGKRACWILQAGLWAPIIQGMVNELADRVHPAFRELISPPCVKKGAYAGCPYDGSNRQRLLDNEQLPPCPLWLEKEADTAMEMLRQEGGETSWKEAGPGTPSRARGIRFFTTDEWQAQKSRSMTLDFERNWGISLKTGRPIQKESPA